MRYKTAMPQRRPNSKPRFSSKPRPQSRPVRDDASSEPVQAPRTERALASFDEIWKLLFSTPVHLDSALSKQNKNIKGFLATILPAILRTPASLGEALGIGVSAGEPWSLTREQLLGWRPARLIFERCYENRGDAAMTKRAQPIRDDFPASIVEEWERDWGTETADNLVSVLGREAPLSLRASRKLGAQKLHKELTAGSRLPVRANISDLVPLGVSLEGYAPVLGSELYASGGFEIQDEGSQFMALFALWPELFGPRLQSRPGTVDKKEVKAVPHLPDSIPVLNVIDACAGAGGKSLALADCMAGKGRLFAYDTVAGKLQALRKRATRAGLNNIQTVVLPEDKEDTEGVAATQAIAQFKQKADVVLVDAPCSGWGVLRRNPDIKWRQNLPAGRSLPELQLRILTQYSALVRPGGRLVYGVCTFRKSETLDLVNAFVAANPGFEVRKGGYLGPGPCDGFFMQDFIRKG